MSRSLVVARAALAALITLAAACDKGDATAPSPTTESSLLSTGFSSGAWTVSSLQQGTEDKASQFDGYTLTFAGTESGALTATRIGKSVSGTWRHSAAVTYYGSTSKESMVINLGSAAPFDRISKTWNVTASTANTVSFEGPELAEQAHLTLVRP
jgi:hypothetical protein